MSRQEVVALKRELLAFWPNNRYGHSTTAPTNEKLKVTFFSKKSVYLRSESSVDVQTC